MGDWRFFVQRPGSGLWLDTDAQLDDVSLDWALSGPMSGEAYMPLGMSGNPFAADNQLIWGRMNTTMYAEEDGSLAWAGICTAADPDTKGLKLEFTGATGWLAGVPFNRAYRVWETNVFDVARELINHSQTYPRHLPITVSGGKSAFTVGDPQPPNFPKQPPRRKGETKSEWRNSKRYEQWEEAVDEWEKKYGKRERYEVVWWEAPSCGDELASLAKEAGFDYQERVRWRNKADLKPEWIIDLGDDIRNRREDIKFVDGYNLAAPLDTKDTDDVYANYVVGLGAGEGRDMVRVDVGKNDGRLLQAEWVQYKSVRKEKRLRSLVQEDLRRFSNTDPEVDNVAVWDMPGYASVATLRCGDEVEVISDSHNPPISTWRRISDITRNPGAAIVGVGLESA